MGGQLHSTGEEMQVWERKGLRVILRKDAERCEQKTSEKRGSGRRETFLWGRSLKGKASV